MTSDAFDEFRLDGKVAVVTGASRGIGRSLAIGLAGAGASVVVTSRTIEACRDVAAVIDAAGGSALAHACDISRPAQHGALLAAAVERFGRIDVLVNNAGILKPHHTVKVSPAELDELLDINLKGPLFLTVAALPHLAAHRAGSVINIGALGAYQPMEGIGAYCAIKAAMANWSTTMAREWAAQGVRVNVLVPGSVSTDMILPVDPERRARFVEDMRAQNLFGRLGQPEDLVGATVFLASHASRFMTGRALVVDGGMMR